MLSNIMNIDKKSQFMLEPDPRYKKKRKLRTSFYS